MYLNKAILNETAPIEIKKITAESDIAYSKLLEVNANIQSSQYD